MSKTRAPSSSWIRMYSVETEITGRPAYRESTTRGGSRRFHTKIVLARPAFIMCLLSPTELTFLWPISIWDELYRCDEESSRTFLPFSKWFFTSGDRPLRSHSFPLPFKFRPTIHNGPGSHIFARLKTLVNKLMQKYWLRLYLARRV